MISFIGRTAFTCSIVGCVKAFFNGESKLYQNQNDEHFQNVPTMSKTKKVTITTSPEQQEKAREIKRFSDDHIHHNPLIDPTLLYRSFILSNSDEVYKKVRVFRRKFVHEYK